MVYTYSGYYTYSVIKAEVDLPRGIACFLKINYCGEDAPLRWPLNPVVFIYCLPQSLVGTGNLLGKSNGNALPVCSKVRKHTCREMYLLVCIMVLFKVERNI